MAKTPAEFEKEFLETIKEKTGKTLADWTVVIKASGMSKPAETLDWLKKTQGLNHLQANLLTGIYRNNGQPVYQNEDNLLEQQLGKATDMRSLFERISSQILAAYPDAQLIPKKTYLSYTAKREFAAINVKPKEIRVAFDLGDAPFEGGIEKAKLTGPMPRMSHMRIYTEAKQLEEDLPKWLAQSYQRSHSK